MKPVGNKLKGKFQKSDDIRRRFARDVRLYQRDELILLLGKKILEEEEGEGRFYEGKNPVLAKHITGPMKLRARYKGRVLSAHVRRDGSIRFKSKIYSSPSQAGAIACKRRSCNGWTFWQYERAPGDWMPLNELRK